MFSPDSYSRLGEMTCTPVLSPSKDAPHGSTKLTTG